MSSPIAVGRAEGLLDVARFRKSNFCWPVARPHAGEEVGLEFEADRQLVAFDLARPLPGLLDLAGDAEQVLHVVADLVGDDVGLGEIARRAELVVQLVEERRSM